MATVRFEQCVFVNCPFDEAYKPILQSISFCVIFLGFTSRLAPENADNGAARLDRIIELVRSSKYGIDDLSRCKANKRGEYSRMNMPFELGVDHGCRKFGDGQLASKAILILEEKRYDYQRALSDISGWDIEVHSGKYDKAIGVVRNWLVAQAGAEKVGISRILQKYIEFQQWYWEQEVAAGSTEEDIKEYPTGERINAMHAWMAAGQPL